jgi:hypothetical protein
VNGSRIVTRDASHITSSLGTAEASARSFKLFGALQPLAISRTG